MGEKPFIKFYPSDFLAGTSGLSPAERGVYITILCLIYEADGGIARDDARLSRRCGMPKAAFKRTIEALLDEGKLIEDAGVLSNKRAEKAIVDRQNRTQNATHAANQKWNAQRQKTQQKQRPDDADAVPPQCVADASQKPEPEPEKERINISAKADDGFDDFWQHVPKKAGKGQARKAWRSALKKADPETIIAAMQGYARQREGQDQQFTAHPATWLNGERWLDEAAPSQQDFYNQIQQHLQGNENALSGPDQNSGITNHRLSAPISAPEPSGQPSGADGNFGHSRRSERPSFDFIKPRRI